MSLTKSRARAAKSPQDVDVAIVEIGGTVGDIESLPFIEAIRQMRHEEGRENTLFVHLTLVPWIAAAQELKTKPTQHSVKELRAIGIQPDILLCRSERPLPEEVKEKIALFCDVDVRSVITAKDVHSVYEVPLVFAEQGVDETILRLLHMEAGPRDLTRWIEMLERMHNPQREVTIGLVGKYVEYEDSYKSLKEACCTRASRTRRGSDIEWIEVGADGMARVPRTRCGDSMAFWFRAVSASAASTGCSMPSGVRAKNKFPYFGICLGMQTMVIEFARNVCGLADADSTEFDPATPHRVIYKLRELKGVDELGGTMRLGAYPCHLAEGSFAERAYGRD